MDSLNDLHKSRAIGMRKRVYVNPLERAYAAPGHLRLWNGTSYTPIKG